MLSCLTIKINHLSYSVLNVAAPCSSNTKLSSNQTCARTRFWSGEKDVLTLEFVL